MRRSMRGALMLLPSVLFFSAAELGFRWHHADEWPFGMVRDDPELGWSLNPGWEGEYAGRRVAVSAIGLRDPRTPERLRDLSEPVLFLGDSVVMGYGVAEDESLPRRLEAELGRPVINAGVVGYATVQEAKLLRRLLREVRPGRVLLGICLNDLASQEQFQMRVQPRTRAARWSEGLRSRSALYHWLRKRIRGRMERWDLLGQSEAGDFDLAGLVARLARGGGTSELREGLGELQEVRGTVPVTAVVFPYRDQMVEGASLLPQELIQAALDQQGIPAIDLTEHLRAAGGPAMFLDPCHLSTEGAGVAARRLAGALAGLSYRAAPDAP